jgi:hypothetical protein
VKAYERVELVEYCSKDKDQAIIRGSTHTIDALKSLTKSNPLFSLYSSITNELQDT